MNSRRKGKRGELALARILREHGFEARRGVQYHGGAESPDVIGLPGVHIECKRVERLDLMGAYRQAVRDAASDEMPAVFHKRNREPWLVTMNLEDFIQLYREAKDGERIHSD